MHVEYGGQDSKTQQWFLVFVKLFLIHLERFQMQLHKRRKVSKSISISTRQIH